MTTHIAFTGSRQITPTQGEIIERKLSELSQTTIAQYHVGDARGVDAVVRNSLRCQVYQAEGRQPWQLAQRSAQMVRAIANSPNAKLIAFPNKPCPEGVKPSKTFSGKGSGTWGTVALAKYHGLAIEVVPLTDGWELPDWLTQPEPKQLSLF
jgi:hypothetical protein